ncbi:unnamed protein product [Blepharisma stoltei]|uniref:WD40 repeat-like protein n=1 Tax=Blepharisma stoltei TaxID=1481888 RepID=A0AAU9KEK8_9CILI|nr:unnamed protein product [Blepharisma stoltei]
MKTLFSSFFRDKKRLSKDEFKEQTQLTNLPQEQPERVIHNRPLELMDPPELNMRDPRIYRGFPYTERLGTSCIGCARFWGRESKNHFSRGNTADVMKQDAVSIDEKTYAVREHYKGKSLYLKIHDTNGLKLDPNVIHPFVRIHIMDITKNSYLTKSYPHSVINYYEGMGQLNTSHEYSSGDCSYIYPFSTPPCDMRITGENDPHWDEEFILDEDAAYVLNPNNVILFEILDFNFRLIKQNSNLLRQDKMYPVAWAFLRPIGSTKMHLGISKLQLYNFKFKPQKGFGELRRPEVYYNFNWYNKELYPSFLRVELRVIEQPERKFVRYMPISPFEREEGEKTYEELEMEAAEPRKLKLGGKEEIDAEALERAKRLTKWRRLYQEDCMIPNKLAFKLQASKLGCWRLSFSHNGKYLAAGCTDETTVIKIYQVEDGELTLTLRGHADLVHDLAWSEDDMYLISSSSDGTTKIWDFTGIFRGGGEATGFTQSAFNPGTAEFLKVSLQHPSYVYSGQFHPDQTHSGYFIIATACFDGNVRFWFSNPESTTMNSELPIIPQQQLDYQYLKEERLKNPTDAELLEHRHPNTIVFDNQEIMYVGDSLGMIHLFSVQIRDNMLQTALIHQVSLDELLGDPINTILLQPPEKRFLLVLTRDNVIRRIEPARAAQADTHDLIDTRFFGAKIAKFAVRNCISPDGRYLLSGSEDGKIYLWDVATGYREDISHLEVGVKDLISDVAWNSTYNMIAVAGFGSELPILIYCYEKTQEDAENALMELNNRVPEEGKDYLAPQKEVISNLAYEVGATRELPSRQSNFPRY